MPFIAQALLQGKVRRAELRYEGRGGLGGFITRYFDRQDRELARPVEEYVNQQLAGALLECLKRRFPEWSAAAGSFGTVAWSVSLDRIRHTHSQRSITITTCEFDGL
jgi:hypothetical protein